MLPSELFLAPVTSTTASVLSAFDILFSDARLRSSRPAYKLHCFHAVQRLTLCRQRTACGITATELMIWVARGINKANTSGLRAKTDSGSPMCVFHVGLKLVIGGVSESSLYDGLDVLYLILSMKNFASLVLAVIGGEDVAILSNSSGGGNLG